MSGLTKEVDALLGAIVGGIEAVLILSVAIVILATLVMFANSRGFPGRRAGIKRGHEAQYVTGQSVPQ